MTRPGERRRVGPGESSFGLRCLPDVRGGRSRMARGSSPRTGPDPGGHRREDPQRGWAHRGRRGRRRRAGATVWPVSSAPTWWSWTTRCPKVDGLAAAQADHRRRPGRDGPHRLLRQGAGRGGGRRRHHRLPGKLFQPLAQPAGRGKRGPGPGGRPPPPPGHGRRPQRVQAGRPQGHRVGQGPASWRSSASPRTRPPPACAGRPWTAISLGRDRPPGPGRPARETPPPRARRPALAGRGCRPASRAAVTRAACSPRTASQWFIRSALVRSRQCPNRPAASASGRRPSTWWISRVSEAAARRRGRGLDDGGQAGRASGPGRGPPAVVLERHRDPGEEAEVVGQPGDQRMPVVQVEVRVQLADLASDRSEPRARPAASGHRGLDVGGQLGQAWSSGRGGSAPAPDGGPRSWPWPGRCRRGRRRRSSDLGTRSQALGHVDEPVGSSPAAYSEEQHRALRPLRPGAEVGEPGHQVRRAPMAALSWTTRPATRLRTGVRTSGPARRRGSSSRLTWRLRWTDVAGEARWGEAETHSSCSGCRRRPRRPARPGESRASSSRASSPSTLRWNERRARPEGGSVDGGDGPKTWIEGWCAWLGSALVLAVALGPVGYHHDRVGGRPRHPFDVAVDGPAPRSRRERFHDGPGAGHLPARWQEPGPPTAPERPGRPRPGGRRPRPGC